MYRFRVNMRSGLTVVLAFQALLMLAMIYYSVSKPCLTSPCFHQLENTSHNEHLQFPPPIPTYNFEEHPTFSDAFIGYCEFQKQFMKWTQQVADHFTNSTSGRLDRNAAYHFLRQSGLKFIFFNAHFSGISNQLRSLASTFLMGMLNGVPHLYAWQLPCPLTTIIEENPAWGNLGYREWRALQEIGFLRALKEDSRNLTRSHWNLKKSNETKSVLKKYGRDGFIHSICKQFPSCHQRFKTNFVARKLYQRILVPNQDTIRFVSENIPHGLGRLPQHLNHTLYSPHPSAGEDPTVSTSSSSSLSRLHDHGGRYPVVGIHLRFGDHFLYNHKPNRRFLDGTHHLPSIMACVVKVLENEMELRDVDRGFLLVATDDKSSIPKVESIINQRFHHRVPVITTEGKAIHTSRSYRRCSSEAKAGYIKLIADVLMLCHSDVFMGTVGSSLSGVISSFCSSIEKPLHFHSMKRKPLVCENN